MAGAGVTAMEEVAGPQEGTGYLPSPIPLDQLRHCAEAHQRLLQLVDRIDDGALRRATLLPAWTVAHLIAHLARNADSHTRMIEAAQAGRISAQYPGGAEHRHREIMLGATQPIEVLRDDLAAAVRRLEHAWDTMHVDTWRTGLGLTASRGRTTLADLVFFRWREVEIHMVDLGLTDLGGPGWDGLSPAYVDAEWEWTVRGLPPRVPPEVTLVLAPGDRPSHAAGRGERVVLVDKPSRVTLRWLTGRGGGDPSWPKLGPWV